MGEETQLPPGSKVDLPDVLPPATLSASRLASGSYTVTPTRLQSTSHSTRHEEVGKNPGSCLVAAESSRFSKTQQNKEHTSEVWMKNQPDTCCAGRPRPPYGPSQGHRRWLRLGHASSGGSQLSRREEPRACHLGNASFWPDQAFRCCSQSHPARPP